MVATVVDLREWRERHRVEVQIAFDPFWVWRFYWVFWTEVCRVPGSR